MLHEFTSQFSANKLYEGYRLLAADGTDMCLPYYPQDALHHFQTTKEARGFNLLHCDCLYDLCNRIYIDVAHESRRSASERRTLVNMIDHSPLSGKVILTADRGYESYNIFAHLQERDWNYVIRVKDINSSGILSGLNLPKKDVFDTTVQIILTKKKTSFVIQEIYARFIMYNFCALIAAQVVIHQKGSKYLYPVNFSAAVRLVCEG